MGTRCVCIAELRVRFSHPPPKYARSLCSNVRFGYHNVPTHNRIVCVRTMRSETMTHRTLLLGRKERWQYENLPVLWSGWKVTTSRGKQLFRRMRQAVMCCLQRMPRTSKPSYLILHFLLRRRLVVGQQVLILLTVVRIHAPQPSLCGRAVKLESHNRL